MRKLKLHLREQVVLFKQLGFFLKSGIGLDEALNLSSATLPEKNRKKKILESLRDDIANGILFSQSLGQHFSSLSIDTQTILQAGENSASLHLAFERVAQELTRREQNHKKLVSALTYPTCIALLTLALAASMTFGIFPKIRPLLESMHTTLPLPTQILIFISDFFTKKWLEILLSTICGSIIFTAILQSTRVRRVLRISRDYITLKMPGLRLILQNKILGSFTATLTTLITSGIPLPLSLVQARPSNYLYVQALKTIEREIETGHRLSAGLERYPALFPETMRQLTAAAEASGSLLDMLSFLSSYFQNEYDELVKKWSSLLEPALMVAMGLTVGFISLAMILPIYALSQSVSTLH